MIHLKCFAGVPQPPQEVPTVPILIISLVESEIQRKIAQPVLTLFSSNESCCNFVNKRQLVIMVGTAFLTCRCTCSRGGPRRRWAGSRPSPIWHSHSTAQAVAWPWASRPRSASCPGSSSHPARRGRSGGRGRLQPRGTCEPEGKPR